MVSEKDYLVAWEAEYLADGKFKRFIALLIFFPFALLHLFLEYGRWRWDRFSADSESGAAPGKE